METSTTKHYYVAPSAEVFTVALESVVCGSPDYAPKFSKPFNDEEQW